MLFLTLVVGHSLSGTLANYDFLNRFALAKFSSNRYAFLVI